MIIKDQQKRPRSGKRTLQAPVLGPSTANPRKATGHLMFPMRVTTQKPVFILFVTQMIQTKTKTHAYAHRSTQKQVVKLLISDTSKEEEGSSLNPEAMPRSGVKPRCRVVHPRDKLKACKSPNRVLELLKIPISANLAALLSQKLQVKHGWHLGPAFSHSILMPPAEPCLQQCTQCREQY